MPIKYSDANSDANEIKWCSYFGRNTWRSSRNFSFETSPFSFCLKNSSYRTRTCAVQWLFDNLIENLFFFQLALAGQRGDKSLLDCLLLGVQLLRAIFRILPAQRPTIERSFANVVKSKNAAYFKNLFFLFTPFFVPAIPVWYLWKMQCLMGFLWSQMNSRVCILGLVGRKFDVRMVALSPITGRPQQAMVIDPRLF